MGAGPLQQPLLDGPGAAPSAPPLQIGSTPYAPASAPPAPAGYPPYDQLQQQQHPGATDAYPTVMGTPSFPPPPAPSPSLMKQHQQQQQSAPYAPPVIQHHTHVYEGPVIQRVNLSPVMQICPSCGHTGPTRVKRERGCCTWLQCFGMCWLFCPLFWLPCCLDCSKDLVHRCGHCNAEIARITPC